MLDRGIGKGFSEELTVMNKRMETSKECRKAFQVERTACAKRG